MSEPVLLDVFTDWLTDDAIFDLITDPPWGAEIDSITLNMEYFGNHSGAKFCSPLVKHLLVNSTLDEAARQKLVDIILARFSEKWKRLWNTVVVEYNPIHNYNMTDEFERTQSNIGQEQVKTDASDNSAKTSVLGSVDSTEHGKTTTDDTYLFGYNSPAEDRNKTDVVESTESGTTSVKHTGSDSEYNNRASTEDIQKANNDIEVEGATRHRFGNIGVTTTQTMIQSERDVLMFNYFDTVFADVDSVLALRFYDPCRV